jgi:chromosome segregation ATPase
MARVAGRDVLVQLMDAVAQLQASQARQDEDIERIIVRLDLMSGRMNGLAGQQASLAQQMAQMAEQMALLSQRMDESSAQMDELAEDLRALRGDFVSLAQHGRETSGGLKRLSEIVVKALGTSEERFDELEARLARLEKKTG